MSDFSGPPEFALVLYSRPRYLASVRAFVSEFAGQVGFAPSDCSQISLAVSEALANVINHGYERRPDGEIRLRLWFDGVTRDMCIVIDDDGRQVDPEHIRSRDLDDIRPGGLGVHIIREIMDDVVYARRDEGGMRLRMVKRAPAPASTCAPGERGHCS